MIKFNEWLILQENNFPSCGKNLNIDIEFDNDWRNRPEEWQNIHLTGHDFESNIDYALYILSLDVTNNSALKYLEKYFLLDKDCIRELSLYVKDAVTSIKGYGKTISPIIQKGKWKGSNEEQMLKQLKFWKNKGNN